MKDANMNTKVDTVLGECESIISGVEVIQELTENNKAFNMFEFDDLRCMAEELQSLVVDSEDDISTNEFAVELSITMYQEIKYLSEAVEEITTDSEILNELGYIRAAVDIIRDAISS